MPADELDTWLLVWEGDGSWRDRIARARDRIAPRDAAAHEILLAEEDGDRHALLLVHWTAAERDAFIAILAPGWAFHFVNAVRDLAD